MAGILPFRTLRPRDDLAARVIALPYDVIDESEARAMAVDPCSFVHITRSEVDLPAGSDPHGEPAYAAARVALDRFAAAGWLEEDDAPALWVYGLRMGEHVQRGFLGGASVAEYDDGRIRKHELTRPDKEDDRARHMEVLDAQVGLVFLAYRATDALQALLDRVAARPPRWDVVTPDGVQHTLWAVSPEEIVAIQAAFAQVPRLYVADGHHRSAAASRLHARRGDDATATFLAGIFPDDALRILPYNRLVHDLAGLDAAGLFARLGERFEVQPGADVPSGPGRVSMYLAGAWYELIPRPGVAAADPVGALDVSLLQREVLAPILGIDDPRRSTRIEFVGGIRGTRFLSDAVDAGRAAVAFSLWPTSLGELFSVADADEIMPPKSTWFEPKLREGVVSRRLR